MITDGHFPANSKRSLSKATCSGGRVSPARSARLLARSPRKWPPYLSPRAAISACVTTTTMSFSALRASVRKAVFPAPTVARARVQRVPAFRRFNSTQSTPPPSPNKSYTGIYAGFGAVAVAGVAFYVYSSQSDAAKAAGTALKSGAQAVKVAANFVPTKEDYIKVIHWQYIPLKLY